MISNTRSAPAWLDDVLHSGRVSRISQHIALIVWHHWNPEAGACELSCRDIAAMTGWGRTAVAEHIAELTDYLIVTRIGGRGKARIEFAGVSDPGIADDDILAPGRRLWTATRTQDEAVVARQTDTNGKEDTQPSVRHADTNEFVARHADTTPNDYRQADTNFVARQADTNPVVARQTDTSPSEASDPPSPLSPIPPIPPTPRSDDFLLSQKPISTTSNGGEGVWGGTPWSASLTYSGEPPSDQPVTPSPAEPMLFAEMVEPKAPRAILPTSRVVDHAIDAYNAAAVQHGWEVCKVRTAARTSRVAKRLTDIGGLEAWKRALTGVTRDDFLSGRIGGRAGQPPFRLSIERLMQTDGNLGDVLARMLDLGMQADVPAPIDGKAWGWWTQKLDAMRKLSVDGWRKLIEANRPNGRWPWHKLGAPPGHPDCAIPAALLAELGFVEKYRGQIKAAEG